MAIVHACNILSKASIAVKKTTSSTAELTNIKVTKISDI